MLLKYFKYFVFSQIVVLIFVLFWLINLAKSINFYDKDLFWNIVIVADFSKSMWKTTIIWKYGREVIKINLEKLIINNLISEWYKRWLVVFANKWYYYIPPTNDLETYFTILSGLDWKQFSQGSNRYDGLRKFAYYSSTGDIWIFLSDFDFNIDKKQLDTLKEVLSKKKQRIIFLNLWKNYKCSSLKILGKCYLLNSYNDFLKIKWDLYQIEDIENIKDNIVSFYPIWFIPFTIF